jgi:hypothetical protein
MAFPVRPCAETGTLCTAGAGARVRDLFDAA